MLQPQPQPGSFRNEGLFTDHYLQDVLPHLADLWDLADLPAIRQRLLDLWEEQADQVAQYSEAQLEDHFIKPALAILGHVIEPQPLAGQHKPDYAFFADDQARRAALPADGRPEYWRHALAVGDAKVWERKLDKASGTDAGWGLSNPSFQVGEYYLARTDCRWGLLTNGRHWRLYAGEPKPDMQRFYEVDLQALLTSPDPDALAYFVLFFCRQALLGDRDGLSFLDRVRAESDRAAARLRENVQDGVYKALLQACRGFVDHEPNALAEVDLATVYDNALVLLYRLLFVLYAEAADLLPVHSNPRYRDRYSLQAINQDVGTNPQVFLEGGVTLWPKLKALFGAIDRGKTALGVPAYNGGLFDPKKHAFLEQHELDDQHVAQVLSRLARTDEGAFVDYRDLGVRHLGSIYEGLLEYKLARATEPMAVVRRDGRDRWIPAAAAGEVSADQDHCEAGDLYLVTDKGERKATGSYYTPPFIVEYIVENTIGPLAEKCHTPEEVLALKVLDPAMGSGHFLVAATDFLARKLLECAGQEGPHLASDEPDLAHMKRLIVERCIYGVDLNPLAVELAKLSLWLDTVAKGQPLSFLDHHLRCGNSLIGARVDRLPVPGRVRISKGRGAAARLQRALARNPMQLALFDYGDFTQHMARLVFGFAQIAQGLSTSREDVQTKGRILADIDQTHRRPFQEIADLWCSGYFGNDYDSQRYNSLIGQLQRGEAPFSPEEKEALDESRALAARHGFLHWELAFPDVFFDEHGRARPDAGFDAVIGNPPWERMKLQENEFFALREPAIALAPTAAKRKALIAKLPKTNPDLWAEYEEAKQASDQEMAWTRESGQYPFMGRGDTNLYAVMTERARSLLAPAGREGFVVPSGIATDSTTSAFFADLVDTKSLQTLLDFENKEGLFADVHRAFKFSIIILTGGEQREEIACGFFLHNAGDVLDPERVFTIHPEDCALMNPNTRTCPVFRSRQDLELTRAVYQRVPPLLRETQHGEENPWGIRYMRMFDMTLDSELFCTAAEIEKDGFYPVAGNAWRKGKATFLPLYEGKMVQMYDHRAASVKVNPENVHRPASPEATTDEEHASPAFAVTPQFWVPASEVTAKVGTGPRWFVAFKDVTAPTNERTMIAAAVPWAGAGNNLPLLLSDTQPAPRMALLLADLCSFAFDYVARQKVGGQHLNFFIVEQLPVLPPERYEEDFHGVPLADFIGRRVLELSYTAHDLAGFAEDMGHVDPKGKPLPPFPWDEERRLHLRCQLDALYFHLYGLTREEAEYVLGTFPIVERHDQERYGRFRTQDLILHYYNAYSAGDMETQVEG
jgi:hypothetical protein